MISRKKKRVKKIKKVKRKIGAAKARRDTAMQARHEKTYSDLTTPRARSTIQMPVKGGV
jgi:hypothetical protein